jgi:hypothetical protein
MPITFEEMIDLVRPEPAMAAGFSAASYDLQIVLVDDVLRWISCWDKVSCIADYAGRPVGERPDPKVEIYANDFPPGPLLAVAFSLSTLARIFPADWQGRVGNELVIWDGNKRLLAMAIRRAKGIVDRRYVGCFVGS